MEEKIANIATLTFYDVEGDIPGTVRVKVDFDPNEFKDGDVLPATHGAMAQVVNEYMGQIMNQDSIEVNGNETVN